MFNHSGVDIRVDESTEFVEDGFTVGNGKVVIYRASSKHGRSYAMEPETALKYAKKQIDDAACEHAMKTSR